MKTPYKITLLIFFVTQLGWSQLMVRAVNYRPTGEFGFVMKPLISVEIGNQQRFRKSATRRWRSVASLLYLNMKPRMDVFPIAGFASDGKGSRVIPGIQSFEKYNLLQLIFGYDYAFVHKEKFNVYVGADLVAGFASVDYTIIYPTWKNETYQGGGGLGGFRVRLGLDYNLTEAMGVFISANSGGFLITEPAGFLSANDFGLGMRYSFK
jgi:hypothetical protein